MNQSTTSLGKFLAGYVEAGDPRGVTAFRVGWLTTRHGVAAEHLREALAEADPVVAAQAVLAELDVKFAAEDAEFDRALEAAKAVRDASRGRVAVSR